MDYLDNQAAALDDRSSTGRIRPWREHKMANKLLAMAYDEINPHKAGRLRGCAQKLDFSVDAQGAKRLVAAWFCRVRLCPMCSWRRALKVGAQMRQIMDYLRDTEPCAYIMLTLTVRNCGPEGLPAAIDDILLGFNRLTKQKAYKAAARGYYRALEITHNLTDDTYHPHIHAVVAVAPSYFTSRYYLAQAKWADMWQEAMRLSYTPIVDVRRVKGDDAAAVAEVAKYTVKPGDYIIPDDWEMTCETVRVLDVALHKRRLIGYGGVFSDAHKALKLEDAETGDLVHVENEDKPICAERIVSYVWYSGYRQYYEVREAPK